LNKFSGRVRHSAEYKDNEGMKGKKVLVVGIGNSAVDVAVNCAHGAAEKVYLSTRSGAWIVPNYLFGLPIDLYACRVLLWLPLSIAQWIYATVLLIIQGNMKKWGLNPKMGPMQTQPTVSATLITEIARDNIKVKSNVVRFGEDAICEFDDGSKEKIDEVVLCTGFSMDFPFLEEEVKSKVLEPSTNILNLYKNVFHPDLGTSISFLGFVQPTSGGILSMSETQARWVIQLLKGKVNLPTRDEMWKSLECERRAQLKRFFQSKRHTIQQDPVLYCDEIASFFGAKPNLWKHPKLLFALLFGSGGAAQWKLDGPDKWNGAEQCIQQVPVAPFYTYSIIFLCILLGLIIAVIAK